MIHKNFHAKDQDSNLFVRSQKNHDEFQLHNQTCKYIYHFSRSRSSERDSHKHLDQKYQLQ